MSWFAAGPAEKITIRDVWLEVRTVRDQVSAMSGNTTAIADLESRMRATERWRYGMPVSVILAIASVGVTIAGLVIK